jgi:hypothetical protein
MDGQQPAYALAASTTADADANNNLDVMSHDVGYTVKVCGTRYI